MPHGWWAAAFAFAMGVCLLASSAAGMKWGALGFFGLAGLMTLVFPHTVLWSNLRNATLWIYPLFALFSATWSINPDRTIHAVILLLPTILAGVGLGGVPDRRAIGAGAAFSFTLYIAYSLAVGATTLFSDTGSGGEALVGITTGKNYFGHLAAMALMTTPLYLPFARGKFAVPVVAFTGAAAAISAFALFQSHATGSMLAAGVSGMIFMTLILFRRVGWQWRVVLIAALIGTLVLYALFGHTLQQELFDTILQKFNKDVSLTGRTFLWDYADRLIEQRPALGYGYGAFWYYTNPEAWTLWRSMGVAPMSGFNFHNTMRETLIECGWIGLVLYVVTFGTAFVRAAWRAVRDGDLISSIGIAFISYFIIRMAVETTGLGGLTIDTLLILAFLCRPLKQPVDREQRIGAAAPPAERMPPPAPVFRNPIDD